MKMTDKDPCLGPPGWLKEDYVRPDQIILTAMLLSRAVGQCWHSLKPSWALSWNRKKSQEFLFQFFSDFSWSSSQAQPLGFQQVFAGKKHKVQNKMSFLISCSVYVCLALFFGEDLSCRYQGWQEFYCKHTHTRACARNEYLKLSKLQMEAYRLNFFSYPAFAVYTPSKWHAIKR